MQTYLEIAHRFMLRAGSAAAAAVEPPHQLVVDPPVQLFELKASTKNRRCIECGFGMSVVAIRDVCGRCARKGADQ